MTRIDEQIIEGGRSFRVDTELGGSLVVVIRDDGARELQFGSGGGRRGTVVRLDDDDARRLGAVLAGIRFRPEVPEEARRHVGDLALEWVRIEHGSAAVGSSMRELELHRRTGMTAIAVVRGDVTRTAPLADVPLEVGDCVVVVGQLRQMQLVQDLLTEG